MDTDKLKALAMAATKGPWMRLFGERTVYDRMEDGCRGNAIVRADVAYSSQDADNLDFIAAANPATVLELIAERDELRAEVERLSEGMEIAVRGLQNVAAVEARAAPAAGTEKDAERLAEGYESGFFASDPRDGDGQFTLHYKTAAQAEAAYMLVTSIIDAAIEAHSKAGKEHA